jgi:ABC-type multidrug transport system fused ATPase/permease subunit
MVWHLAPRLLATLACLTLLEAPLSAASLWILKRIIDTVAAAVRGPTVPISAEHAALALAGCYILVVCFHQSLRGTARLLQNYLFDLVGGQVRQGLMREAGAYPDLSPFESPRFHDRLQLLEHEAARQPMALFAGIVQFAQSGLLLACMAGFLARFHPGIVLLLLGTALPGVLAQRRLGWGVWYGLHDAASLRRRLLCLAQVLLTAPFASECNGRWGVRDAVGFRLEGVAFAYPGSERRVFEELELEISWGKTTALVGENGAGKSTLVKLLARLYDPSAGRILLNGIDLREYDLEDLRRQMTAVFQDFAHYPLPVWENVGLGDPSRLHDREQIREAMRRSGADTVIRRLPRGEETLLGREFEGGT